MARPSHDFFGPRPEGYYQATHRPLNCLVFLLPLILVYEIGSLWVGSVPIASPPQRVTAFAWILDVLGLFASVPTYLPGLLLVLIFILWHVFTPRRAPLRWGVVGGMVIETVMLTIPLVVLNMLFQFYSPTELAAVALQATAPAAAPSLGEELVIALTAGIYEELIFRLLLIWLGKILLVDLLGLNRTWSMAAVIIAAALLFGTYHYVAEPFAWRSFLFRTMAGVYLGLLMVMRGFGITVGVHALYDVILVPL